jgi:hypothetical protein
MVAAMGVLVSLLLAGALLGSDAASIAAARAKAENPQLPFADRSRPTSSLLGQSFDASLYAGYSSLLIANHDYASALSWIAKGSPPPRQMLG